MERLSAIISGRVQGVSFRYDTRQTARALALSGWVCNLPDGRVEVLAEGQRPALQALLEFLQVGPSGAEVQGVESQWSAAQGGLRGFEIRYYGD